MAAFFILSIIPSFVLYAGNPMRLFFAPIDTLHVYLGPVFPPSL